MRIEENTRYHSFVDLPVSKTTKKKQVNQEEKEKFLGRCKVCNSLLSYITGTNVVVCTNPECKGIKRKDSDQGYPIYHCLNRRNTRIANNMFGDE